MDNWETPKEQIGYQYTSKLQWKCKKVSNDKETYTHRTKLKKK